MMTSIKNAQLAQLALIAAPLLTALLQFADVRLDNL